jgi:PII-like signaling protein
MTGVFLLSERITGKLLRIFVDEDDRYEGRPLYMAIVDALKAAGFTGATVLKGIEGYGIHKMVHAARTFDMSTNLPILIEVIEEEAKIVAFLPALRAMVSEGLITLENLELMRISRGTP